MKQKMLLDYNVYMAKYVNPQAPPRSPTASDSPGQSPESSPKTTKKVGDRGIKKPFGVFRDPWSCHLVLGNLINCNLFGK